MLVRPSGSSKTSEASALLPRGRLDRLEKTDKKHENLNDTGQMKNTQENKTNKVDQTRNTRENSSPQKPLEPARTRWRARACSASLGRAIPLLRPARWASLERSTALLKFIRRKRRAENKFDNARHCSLDMTVSTLCAYIYI